MNSSNNYEFITEMEYIEDEKRRKSSSNNMEIWSFDPDILIALDWERYEDLIATEERKNIKPKISTLDISYYISLGGLGGAWLTVLARYIVENGWL